MTPHERLLAADPISHRRPEAIMVAATHAKRSGAELALQVSDATLLRRSIRGEVVLPEDVAYDQARRVWNGMIDRRPAAIAYLAGPDDVVAAINFARSRNLLVAVRA